MIKTLISKALMVTACGMLWVGLVGCENVNRSCDQIQNDLMAQGPSLGSLNLVQEFASSGCFDEVLRGL